MRTKGFTLIELMIVVSVIGLLAAIAVPKLGSTIAKSREAATKGNLASLRSAITIYVADTEGLYPTDDLTCLVGNFIREIPYAKLPPYHDDSNFVKTGSDADIDDSGGWFYYNNSADVRWGTVIVNCTHSDSKGIVWSDY